MATTTNYSWTTPDDTALVKDGAAAIRTLGSSIDTTTKALNPSTTLGDIEYRSSTANTNTRLPIGTTGQVLTVSGGVPAWASGGAPDLVQIATGSMSGTSVSITGLSTYNDIYIQVYNAGCSSDYSYRMRINSNTGNNYDMTAIGINRAAANDTATNAISNDYIQWQFISFSIANNSNMNNFVRLSNCKSAGFTQFSGIWGAPKEGTSSISTASVSGIYKVSEAVSSIQLITSTGSWNAGTYVVWGA